MITDGPEAGRPSWLYLLAALTLAVIVVQVVYYIIAPEDKYYEVLIEGVYVNENGTHLETNHGVFKYPQNGVSLYESDTGQDYILRSKDSKDKDKVFLTEYTLNELEGDSK